MSKEKKLEIVKSGTVSKPKPLTFKNREFEFKDLLEKIITHYRGGPLIRFTLLNCDVKSIPEKVIIFRQLKIRGRYQLFFMGLFLGDYVFIKKCHFIAKNYVLGLQIEQFEEGVK